MRTTQTTGPIGDVLEPAFVLVADGVKYTALTGEVDRYGAGEYLVASVDLPVVGSIIAADEDEPFIAVAFWPRPDRIASLLLDAGAASGLPASSRRRPSSSATHRRRWWMRWRPAPYLDQLTDLAALAPGIEREILWRPLFSREYRRVSGAAPSQTAVSVV